MTRQTENGAVYHVVVRGENAERAIQEHILEIRRKHPSETIYIDWAQSELSYREENKSIKGE
jgi:hypothetical protein